MMHSEISRHSKIWPLISNGETQILDQFAKTEKVYRYSLIAELDDFKEALEIGKDIFSQTLNKLNKSSARWDDFTGFYIENFEGKMVSHNGMQILIRLG